MALSRSMKEFRMAPPGTDPRRAGGRFGQAQPGGSASSRLAMANRGRQITQRQGRQPNQQNRPALGTFGQAQNQMRQQRQPLSARNRPKPQPPGRPASGQGTARAVAGGMPTGTPRAPVTSRPGATGGAVRGAVGQDQNRFQAARGAKPQPPAGAFGFLGRQQQRPGFGARGSRQRLR